MSTAVALLLLLIPLAGHGDDAVVQHLDGSGRISLTGGAGFAVDRVDQVHHCEKVVRR